MKPSASTRWFVFSKISGRIQVTRSGWKSIYNVDKYILCSGTLRWVPKETVCLGCVEKENEIRHRICDSEGRAKMALTHNME
jgi:hypothetical protein